MESVEVILERKGLIRLSELEEVLTNKFLVDSNFEKDAVDTRRLAISYI